MTESILFNFRIPMYLKESLEKSCTRRNVSMTSQLNILIHEFIVQDESKQHEVTYDDYEPVSILSSNHYYEEI
jgi:hypothetical protein